MAYGTDTGVYFSNVGERGRDPVHVLEIPDVMQVDILEDYDLLIVLSGNVLSFTPLRHRADCVFFYYRTICHDFPTGGVGPKGPYCGTETRQTDIIAYFFLQSWYMLRKDAGVCCESERTVQYDQDTGAY